MKSKSLYILLATVLAVFNLQVIVAHNSFYRAPQFGQGEIEFSVANQQYSITDQTFDIQFKIASGSPDQIKFTPSVSALNSGLNIIVDWSNFDFANISELTIERPYGIRPGDYECELSMRNSQEPGSEVSMPFLLSVIAIDFDMNRNLLVCGDEETVNLHITDIEGRPNIIKFWVDTTIDKNILIETSWMPFDIFDPYIELDLSGIPEGMTITEGVKIALADSTTKDTAVYENGTKNEHAYTAYAIYDFEQIGRGSGENFLGTKFNNCLVFVDNSGTNGNTQTFVSYQWYKDGEMIEGATDQYYFDVDSKGNMVQLNGTYQVSAVDTEGNMCLLCPLTFSPATRLPYNRSSIIYPNPTDTGQQATLKVNLNIRELDDAVMRIYDLNGNLAYIMVGLNEYNQLPILPTNEYLVIIESPLHSETIKFIVK